MKRLLITFASATLLASTSSADITTKISGTYEAQAVYLKQGRKDAVEGNKKFTNAQKHYGFDTSAGVKIVVENETDAGLKYGAQIGLETTSSISRAAPSFIYIESNSGRFEIGSGKTAAGTMKITGFAPCCATAGGWDSYAVLDPAKRGIQYVTGFGDFLGSKVRASGKTEYARKITYYTPKFYGFQVGVTYIPDTSNAGYASMTDNTKHEKVSGLYTKLDADKKPMADVIDVKNGVSLGVTYEKQVNPDLSFKIAATGESGSPVSKSSTAAKIEDAGRSADKIGNVKLKKLRAYTVGTEVTYKRLTVAGSYGNYMKSFTSIAQDGDKRSTHLYSVGAGYKFNDSWSASTYHFGSNNKGNKVNSTGIAVDYTAITGLRPYVEFVNFNSKGRYLKNDAGTYSIKSDKRKGNMFIIGTKISF